MRLVLYTGKGGVGKTTTAAAAAVVAAERGLRTLVASADVAHSLGDVLGERLGPEPRQLAPGLFALEIDPRVESARHWGRIQQFLERTFRHQGIEAAVAEELAMLPGAEELTTLLAVEQLAECRRYDLLVLDCAPTDAALRLVTLPEVASGMIRLALQIAGALSGVAVPLAKRVVAMPLPDSEVFAEAEALLYRNLAALRARLSAPGTTVRLVVTPERMVIDEARRAHTELALFEVACDAVIVNRMLPEGALSEPFFRDWGRVQAERLAEIESGFGPLPVFCAPLQDDEVIGLPRLASHGRALFGDTPPDAVLSRAQPVRFARERGAYWVRVPVPGVDPARLDVAVVGGDLVISTPARRRRLSLPRRYAPLSLRAARVHGGTLHVRFERDERPTAAGGEAG
ncbi:MAG TPA: TRC40/GET3/ArsA family transport-energizing ATPase [Myxococcota bacterium]|nr:TRC40/GET3/ArsA family transport-energizing ATPase [Myxococcota bacterium]